MLKEDQEFANRQGIKYLEASAKTDSGINCILAELCNGIIERVENGELIRKQSNDYKFSLSSENLFDFPFDKDEKDFEFIVNGQLYKTSRFIADILSPKVRELHLVDPTIDEFCINTKMLDDKNENDKDYFVDFFEFIFV